MSLRRIDELFHFEKGVLQSSKCTTGDFNFITASAEWKTHNEYSHDCEALVFAAAASGSLGRTHYVNGKFIASDLCFIITAKDPENFPVDLKFYHTIFNEFKDDIVKNTKAGTSKEAIGLKSFGQYRLPYFSIEKQVEAKEQFVEMQSSKVLLHEELTHQLVLIQQLRQAFLREAMQGKLVKNINVVETGQQLLEKIKAEKAKLIAEKKIKKEKELPPIAKDEIPFEIPEHWAWCRLGEVSIKIHYGFNASANVAKNDVRLLRITDIQNNTVDWATVPGCEYTAADLKNYLLKDDDILVARTGGTIGKTYIVQDIEDISSLFASYLIRCIPSKNINAKFLKRFMESPLYWQQLLAAAWGAGQPNVNGTSLMNLVLPIPPLTVQAEIVRKLQVLMVYLDNLEQNIKQNQKNNEMLLQQVLREALQPKSTDVIEELFEDQDYQMHLAMLHKLIKQELGINYGEVATQKTVFHINSFTKEKIPYPFINSNYGTYSYQLRDDLQKNRYLTKATISKKEVFTVEASKENEVICSLAKPENKAFVNAVKEILAIYKLPFINKETDKIELLNTVSKTVMDSRSTELEIVYQGLKDWKISQGKYKCKADKFSKKDVEKMILLLQTSGLMAKLLS